jgi:hypothetical protein
MAEALVRHDELIAGVVEAHGGRFVKSMGEGDSTASVFESAASAVKAAIEATCASAASRGPMGAAIRARFGLHTGEAQKTWWCVLRHGREPCRAGARRGGWGRGPALGDDRHARERRPSGAVRDRRSGAAQPQGHPRPEAIKAIAGPGLMTAPAAAECPIAVCSRSKPQIVICSSVARRCVDEVLARIAPGRLLAVLGASGSGKSSLLRAGLLAAVAAGELPCASSARLITSGC